MTALADRPRTTTTSGLVQWLYFVAIGRLPVGIALLREYLAPVLVGLGAAVSLAAYYLTSERGLGRRDR